MEDLAIAENKFMDWPIGQSRAIETAVLFVDLLSSSDFGSILGLEEYADYIESFQRLCLTQCKYFFESVHQGQYRRGLEYEVRTSGDELLVFLSSDNPANDIYQLVCLAITLKCGWLGTPQNAKRIICGMPTAELAAGIHTGKVWARRDDIGLHRSGFVINTAKRVESISREGRHFRIFITAPAFKQLSLRIRNLLFTPREQFPMKGVVVPIGVHEIMDSFVNPGKRLHPMIAESFKKVARQALASNTYDLWIHSCLQVWEEAQDNKVTDECRILCMHILNIDPRNPVALYYAAQAMRERKDTETARLYLESLTHYWPNFADGWLELGRLLKAMGEQTDARRALLQARRHGVAPEEEDLP